MPVNFYTQVQDMNSMEQEWKSHINKKVKR